MKKSTILFSTFWFIITHTQKEGHHYTLNFFIREYPVEKLGIKQIDHQTIPHHIMKKTFYQPVNIGVYVTYNGYITRSNEFGLITFPRKTQIEKFYLLTTRAFKPTFLLDNTIDQWQITNPKESKIYQISRQKNKELKLHYWKTVELNRAHHNTVPLHSIVVLSKPENMYVPLGVTPTSDLPNLILPTIYAKRQLDHLKQALFVLNIKQFFAPVQSLYKTEKLTKNRLIHT